MKAIETSYCGYRFRSRLEARWAVFFQTLGLRWEYEPEGFDLGFGVLYLPDFRVWYPGRCASEARYEWFEVKPSLRLMTPAEWQKVVLFDREVGITLLDGPPAETVYIQAADALYGGPEWRCMEPVPPKPQGFVPGPKELDSICDPQRAGSALWSGYERLWTDYAHSVFGYPPDQSAIGAEAVTLLRKAIRTAREFNMHERQRKEA